jgi:hypothetical protein
MNQPRDAILVAGSANVDFVVRAAQVPAPGETVLGRDGIGAQSSIPKSDEVDALLRSHGDVRHGALDELAAYCGLKSSLVISSNAVEPNQSSTQLSSSYS